MKDLISLMPEVLAALQSTGANVSLAQDLEDAIEADRQRRGEPVAWRTYDRNGWYVFSPTHEEAERGFPGTDHQPLYAAPQPAVPVKVPSDAEYDVVFIPIVLKQVG